MRIVLVFSSILFLTCLVGMSQQSTTKDLVQLAVMFIELTIQHVGTINLVKNESINLDINNTDVLEGIVGFEKISWTGLEGLKVDKNNIDFNLTGSIFSFCANLSIPNNTTSLEIVKYEVDIALLNAIPLYGRGKLVLGLRDLDLALCSKINFEETVQLTDFYLKPGLSGLQFELTGFWNNPQLSEAITKVIATLEGIVMSFWANEIKCITCILSISLEHIINHLLNPSTAIKDFYKIAELTKSDCKGDCVLANYPFLRTIYNTNTSDLLNSLSKDDNIMKFLHGMADYLNEYLEEQL